MFEHVNRDNRVVFIYLNRDMISLLWGCLPPSSGKGLMGNVAYLVRLLLRPTASIKSSYCISLSSVTNSTIARWIQFYRKKGWFWFIVLGRQSERLHLVTAFSQTPKGYRAKRWACAWTCVALDLIKPQEFIRWGSVLMSSPQLNPFSMPHLQIHGQIKFPNFNSHGGN